MATEASDANGGSSRLAPTAPAVLPVRSWGAILFTLTFVEGALGIVSAGQGTSSAGGLLVAHVAFGIGLVALAVWALAAIWGSAGRRARLSTAFATGALVCTAGTGAIFLVTGFAQGAAIDRGLALLSLAGTVLMMISG